jgi:hypothetical protein
MAGFEVVVRPMIFPNIRPVARPSIVPVATDPAQGLIVIRGASAKTIDLPYSSNTSFTVTFATKETKRRVDVARIYQKTDDGGGATRSTVNRSNYIDVEVANQITMLQSGGTFDYDYQRVQASDNVEIIRENVTRRAT